MLRKTLQDCVRHEDPILAPDYTEADVQALRAVANGYGTEDQQKRAIKFFIEDICGTYDFPFRPGPVDRETNVALGRVRAGQILVYFLNDAPTETPVAKIAARVMGVKKHG